MESKSIALPLGDIPICNQVIILALVIILVGARSGVRTLDTLIKSQVLYQLS